MSKKILEEIKAKDLNSLGKEAELKKVEITKTQAEIKAGKEKNLKKVKNLRRELAQMLTVKRQKELMTKEEKKTGKGKEETK